MTHLEPHKGIPRYILLMMAALAGVTVANLYYNQALLDLICKGGGHIPSGSQLGHCDNAGRLCIGSVVCHTAGRYGIGAPHHAVCDVLSCRFRLADSCG